MLYSEVGQRGPSGDPIVKRVVRPDLDRLPEEATSAIGDQGDVAEVVHSELFRKPRPPPRLAVRIGASILPLPIVRDTSAGFLNRSHLIQTQSDTAAHPPQPGADYQNKDDQSPYADSEPMAPRFRKGLGSHLSFSGFRLSSLD